MADKFFSVQDRNNSTIEIEKSKFISYLSPVESEEEAIQFINEIKKQHHDATHNVSAFVLRSNNDLRRYSDDGEPSGTAGLPTLNAIIHKNLTDICIVTTRYFGGIKLGTGGLSRAYAESANQCISNTKILEYQKMTHYQLILAYEHLNTIQYYLKSKDILIGNMTYLENIEMDIYLSVHDTETIENLINMTSSNIQINEYSTQYISVSNNQILSKKEI